MNDEKKNEIRKHLRCLALKRIEALQEVDSTKIHLNPYLLRLLSLNSVQEIAEFVVSQRLERSVVTSYGSRIQSIAKILADEGGTGVEGADICKVKNGRRHYFQIKAGPNTPNKDITKMINTLMAGATRRNHGSVALLGMTYGNRESVSSIIQRYSQIDWLIGKEFWAFIGDSPSSAHQIFDLVTEVVTSIRAPEEESYSSLYRKKVDEVASQLRKKYGDSGNEMWEKLFEDSM
jgi:hypothetical protein